MDTVPACRADACKQGRGTCKTPDACRLPERTGPADMPEGFAIALLLVIAAVAFIGIGVLAVAGRFGWLT